MSKPPIGVLIIKSVAAQGPVDLSQLRERARAALASCESLRQDVDRENRYIQARAAAAHDAINAEAIRLRKAHPTTLGDHQDDVERAYQLACQKRAQATQTLMAARRIAPGIGGAPSSPVIRKAVALHVLRTVKSIQ